MGAGRFVVWTVLVAAVWVVLAASFADDETCSWVCFSVGDMLMLLAIPAVLVWTLGLTVLHLVGRRSRRTD